MRILYRIPLYNESTFHGRMPNGLWVEFVSRGEYEETFYGILERFG